MILILLHITKSYRILQAELLSRSLIAAEAMNFSRCRMDTAFTGCNILW